MANIIDDPASCPGEFELPEAKHGINYGDFNNGSQSDDTNSTGDTIEPAVDCRIPQHEIQREHNHEKVELEPGHVEERFRVDRKKMELMLQTQGEKSNCFGYCVNVGVTNLKFLVVPKPNVVVLIGCMHL